MIASTEGEDMLTHLMRGLSPRSEAMPIISVVDVAERVLGTLGLTDEQFVVFFRRLCRKRSIEVRKEVAAWIQVDADEEGEL